MKKLILTSLLAAATLASQAGYRDYFYMTYKGQEIANGATIVCNDYVLDEEGYFDEASGDFLPCMNFECELNTVVVADGTQYAEGGMYYYNPTEASFLEKFKSGAPGFCANPGSCYTANYDLENNCGFSANIAFAEKNPIGWLIHLYETLPGTFTEATFMVKFVACERVDSPQGEFQNPIDGDDKMPYDLFPYENGDYTFYLKFTPSANSVAELGVAEGAAEYYNLQGVRVAEPEEGLYIVRRGSKVTKELIRK